MGAGGNGIERDARGAFRRVVGAGRRRVIPLNIMESSAERYEKYSQPDGLC